MTFAIVTFLFIYHVNNNYSKAYNYLDTCPIRNGGARVIYYYLNADGVVYLVSLYARNVQENLTARQTKQLKELSIVIETKIQEAKDHE